MTIQKIGAICLPRSISTNQNQNEMNEFYQLPNYREIVVTFLGPTNHRGARVKLHDTTTTQKVVLSYDPAIGNIGLQGLKYLLEKGFNPVCRTSTDEKDTILCDNWGRNFANLK